MAILAQIKTNRRYTAESPITTATNHAVVMAFTSLFPVVTECSNVSQSTMSEGASVLQGIVSKLCGGVAIGHVNPALLLSSEDTKVNIFEGTA
jgi:hypothetical protein